MSHNPNTVKSQDDTDEDELGRTMTLLRAIEQLEKTECELERAETENKWYSEQLHEATKQIEILQKQLDIAVNLLKEIRAKIKTVYDIDLRRFETTGVFDTYFVEEIDHKIKELDNE